MNAAAQKELPGTNILALVEANPVMVLTDREKFSQFYEEMKRETDALVVDLTTDKGRKAIASMARRVATTKVLIDDAGKKLNEGKRAEIDAVDESRREIRQQLDALRDEVRRPLTEWEDAEKAREEEVREAVEKLRRSTAIEAHETSADIRARRAEIEAMDFDRGHFGGYYEQAVLLREQALVTLAFTADKMDQEEADRAELERLRAEAVERDRKESERIMIEEADAKRVAAEKAEQERLARVEEEQKAKIVAAAKEAEEAAKARAEAAHAEEIAKLQRERDEAEAARQAETDRIAREDEARKAEERRVAAEQAKREADQQHRSAVLRGAKEAIMEAGGIEEVAAKSIVLAIAAGNVPGCRITF